MATKLMKVQEGKLGKLPPQSVEAEEAILGAILSNPAVLNRIVEFIKPESFYKPAHKIIYDAIINLFIRNDAIDIVTVSEYLRENEKLEIVGGRAYVNDLALNSITSANIEFYAKIVQEKEIKRALINAGSEIVTMAYDNHSTEATLDTAEKLIFNIATQKNTSDLTAVKDLVLTSYEQIQYRYEHRDELSGVATGFYELDEMTSGLQKSDLIILAARPSMGKTAFALNIAQNVALRGNKKAVALFSLEMPKSQLVKRMLCSEAEIDTQRISSGHMQPKDWEKLTLAMNEFTDTPIYIDDTGSVSVLDIRAKCRRLAMEEKNLGLIVIDYLQLMEGGSSDDRNQQISAISRGLKTLARELEVPIIALSQLSRAVESRSDKRPMLSDLRDSGAIEQDADIVMFIYRDEYYDKDSERKGKADIILAKHRNGPVGSFDLIFQPNITKFKNPITDKF